MTLSPPITFSEIVNDILKGIVVDYEGLWGIAWYYRNNLGVSSDAEVKEKTLAVVREIMKHNVCPVI